MGGRGGVNRAQFWAWIGSWSCVWYEVSDKIHALAQNVEENSLWTVIASMGWKIYFPQQKQ